MKKKELDIKKNKQSPKQIFAKPDANQPLNLWLFVLGLNLLGLTGFIYLKLNGIDLYAFRGGS